MRGYLECVNMTTFPPLKLFIGEENGQKERKLGYKVKKVNNVNLFSRFNNIPLLPKV